MCIGCWRSFGSPTISTPGVRAAARLAYVFEATQSTCSRTAHAVLVDWYLEDEYFDEYSVIDVLTTGSWVEYEVMRALAALSVEERASALALRDGIFGGWAWLIA